jgi:prolyl 4-hydroxylase
MERRVLAPGIVIIDGFFDVATCRRFVDVAEAAGFEDAPITTGRGAVMNRNVRNNRRAIVDDAALAAELWEPVRPHLEAFDDVSAFWGRLPASGVNERLRFYRYGPGEKFEWHHDGCYVRPDGSARSWLTFMVYLDDGCVGGATILEHFERIAVEPIRGRALLFLHQLRHTGAEVIAGQKDVVRTDVMFPA